MSSHDVGETGRQRPRLRSSAGTTFGRKLAVATLSLANVLIIARVLGPAGRGEVVFATTLATIAAQFATMSVQEANINLAGREPALRPKLASNSVVLAVVGTLVAIAALAVLTTAFPGLQGETSAVVRWLAFAGIPALIISTYLERLLDADYRFAFENLASLLTPVVILAVNAALALADALTVNTAVAAWVGGLALGALARVVYVGRRLGGFARPDFSLARRMLRFGAKAHGARVMGWGNYRVDHLLVGAIAGPRELGLYSYAVSWAETLYYLPQTLVSVQRPDLVRATRGEAGRLAAAIFRLGLLLSLAGAAGLVVLAPLLCEGLAGDEFAGSVDDLRVLVAGTVGILALQLLGSALTARQRPELETAATGAALAATIVLDVLLIPPFGGLGAAAASAAAYTVGGAVAVLLASRLLAIEARDLAPGFRDLQTLRRVLSEMMRRGRSRTGQAQ